MEKGREMNMHIDMDTDVDKDKDKDKAESMANSSAPDSERGEDSPENSGRKQQARNLLFVIFAISVLLSLIALIPNALNTILSSLEEVGVSVPAQLKAQPRESLQYIAFYGYTGAAISGVYLIGKLIKFFSSKNKPNDDDNVDGTPKGVSQNPIVILLEGLLSILGQVLGLIGTLADALEVIIEGLLSSIERLYDAIEIFLEYNLARRILALLYFALSLSWLLFTAFFISKYLLTSNLQWALWALAAATLAFSCQTLAIATLRRRRFRDVVLPQLRLASEIGGGFVLVFYTPIYYMIAEHNSFLEVGPITKVALGFLMFLLIFELGRRAQQSIKRRKQ